MQKFSAFLFSVQITLAACLLLNVGNPAIVKPSQQGSHILWQVAAYVENLMREEAKRKKKI